MNFNNWRSNCLPWLQYNQIIQFKLKMQDHTSKKKIQQKINVLNKYEEKFESSPEWGRVQYTLQMAYGNVSLYLKNLYAIANSVTQNKFMSKHQDKVMIDFFLPQSQLSQQKNEDFTSVCEKGFQQILSIRYGHLDLNDLNKQNDDYYQIMVCRAAIGRTFTFPAKNMNDQVPRQQKPQLMNNDFDSLFIYDQSYVSKEFRQDYIVYKSNQNVLPLYIVHFAISDHKYKQLREKKVCDLCQDSTSAQKYCQTEDITLCISCDASHHANKVSLKHKRTDVADKPKVVGNCPVHPSIKLDLFCLECNRPLCVNCKIKGDHYNGENLMHNLIRVTQKYADTAKLLKDQDPGLEKKRKQLLNAVTNVQARLKDINRKSNEVQQKLYQMMQKALKQLQNITKIKISFLMSDHIQLKRQLDQIQWMQTFIKHQFEILSPNDFLLSWERQNSLRKTAIGNKFATSKVLPDMKIEGFINITTEQESRRGQMERNPNNRQQEEITEFGKSTIFNKLDDRNSQIMKSKLAYEDIKESETVPVKSKNNLLNLSLLKHL